MKVTLGEHVHAYQAALYLVVQARGKDNTMVKDTILQKKTQLLHLKVVNITLATLVENL
ncbi:hypothetical protein [Saccharicrinis sp. GN24d3]|uniref:hypothetical protein n=1 Tax=Saccharicrinis sp. GN24d3 TaxID=3458416 RepID=UPI00403711DD